MDRRDDLHFLNASEAYKIPLDEVTWQQHDLAKFCACGAPDGAAALENLKLLLRGIDNWRKIESRTAGR